MLPVKRPSFNDSPRNHNASGYDEPEVLSDRPNVYTMTIFLLGLFLGSAALVFLGGRTLVYIDTVFHGIVLLGLGAMGIHYLFLRHLKRHFIEVAGYCIVGWGMLLMGILLAINFFGHGARQEKIYPMPDLSINGERFTLPDNYYMSPEQEKYFSDQYVGIDGRKPNNTPLSYTYIVAPGALGYDVILSKKELKMTVHRPANIK